MSAKGKRDRSGYLIKQRAFLKVYLLSSIEKQPNHGNALLEELIEKFKPYAYQPQHSEVYRALHELMEDGYLRRNKVTKEGSKYQEIAIYYIKDKDLVNAYKKTVKADLERSLGLIKKALDDNYI